MKPKTDREYKMFELLLYITISVTIYLTIASFIDGCKPDKQAAIIIRKLATEENTYYAQMFKDKSVVKISAKNLRAGDIVTKKLGCGYEVGQSGGI